MLGFLRLIFVFPLFIVICIIGTLISLVQPFHRNNTYIVAQLFSKLARLVGIKLIIRVPKHLTDSPKVIIANHQSNYDVITISGGVTPGVVSVGKKSLKWIPLFGQLYWLSGNIFIDRSNKSRAKQTMTELLERMRKSNLSIWMFPEGTRSKGRGLLPFKMGAFHIALQAKVPLLPIVLSSLNSFSINRWDNGYAIIENLEPIETDSFDETKVKELAKISHIKMLEKIKQLDAEVAELNLK
ncbi:MAG: 1-acylglycerol-3-phosphate O-acyltransferase [Kangiellaceae bacterium]|nr:1-acylglycerol-3-phosphate O-acyltransferase [Kangiellaceae bacterium]